MKVLLVDDESYMTEYLKKLVDWKSYGFEEVLTASGGSIARDLIEQKKPELLVTDIRMPRVSGLDLVKYIDEKNYPTKTIILSGYSEFEYAQQALRYGVTEYLVKPILKKDFQISLEHVMEKFFEKEESFPDDGISAVKKYIAEHVGEDLSLEILGEVAHLHPAYLSKTFKEETGKNLSAYITDVKMERPAELGISEPHSDDGIENGAVPRANETAAYKRDWRKSKSGAAEGALQQKDGEICIMGTF